MPNETITANLIREYLRQNGYYTKGTGIKVEEQQTKNEQINKLLKNPSKRKPGQKGYPDFIITKKGENNFIIIIECKANPQKHQSKEGGKHQDYAVDGVKLYASYLAKELDVLCIAVSGQNEEELKISHYLQLKNEKKAKQVFGNRILNINSYLTTYKEARYRVDYDSLLQYIRKLNDNLQDQKIPENQRAILFSGVLIALEDDTFYKTFEDYTDAKRLGDFLIKSLVAKLKEANLNPTRVEEMEQAYSFIKTHTALIDEGYLLHLVKEIKNEVTTFIKSNQYKDILSQVYIEFLRYANNHKGLGIVLTPPHITQLFCELARVNKDSIVLDNCCGTGGFLISAMESMIKDAKGDREKEKEIKKNQLIGIEYQDSIFALCCSNMILHGDGKTNIIKADCFKKDLQVKKGDEKEHIPLTNYIKSTYKPNIGFLNPPYNAKKDSKGEELRFVLNNLDMLQPGSTCIAILPMSCALGQKGKILLRKQELLQKHTLLGVMSMPNELFHNSNVSVVTCIMVFKAHEPHPKNHKTYFGYWKNDGFLKRKPKGRLDANNAWDKIKADWLQSYHNKEVKKGLSITKEVTAHDEWCAEAYMETDYSQLTREDFIKTLKDYVAFQFSVGNLKIATMDSIHHKKVSLSDRAWKWFRIGDIFQVKGTSTTTLKTLGSYGEGEYPYVTTQALNNGVAGFYNHYTEQGKIIAIDSAVIGYTSYQEKRFSASDHVEKLTLVNGRQLNSFLALFLTTFLNKEQYRYNYGRKRNQIRIKKEKIKLPITQARTPDWEFMEDYIKSLPYSSNLG